MADVWVIAQFSLPTKLVDQKNYGVPCIMGYLGYGIRGLRLYLSNDHQGCLDSTV